MKKLFLLILVIASTVGSLEAGRWSRGWGGGWGRGYGRYGGGWGRGYGRWGGWRPYRSWGGYPYDYYGSPGFSIGFGI